MCVRERQIFSGVPAACGIGVRAQTRLERCLSLAWSDEREIDHVWFSVFSQGAIEAANMV